MRALDRPAAADLGPRRRGQHHQGQRHRRDPQPPHHARPPAAAHTSAGPEAGSGRDVLSQRTESGLTTPAAASRQFWTPGGLELWWRSPVASGQAGGLAGAGQVLGDGLGAGVHLQLLVDAADVGVDGVVADGEAAPRFPCRGSPAPGGRAPRARAARARPRRRRGRLSRNDCTTLRAMWPVIGEPPRWTSRMPREQLVRRRPLEQVAGGAGGERAEDQVGVLVDREHHDLHGRQRAS